jgi:fatty-acyl-CoA synthase
MEGVDVVEVIGLKHTLFDEGIFAFVRPGANITLSSQDVMEHCKSIASYKRPQHVEIWPQDKELPLTRSTKVDKLKLIEIAETIVEDLRNKGAWDAIP